MQATFSLSEPQFSLSEPHSPSVKWESNGAYTLGLWLGVNKMARVKILGYHLVWYLTDTMAS